MNAMAVPHLRDAGKRTRVSNFVSHLFKINMASLTFNAKSSVVMDGHPSNGLDRHT